MKIYVASSWRNDFQPAVVTLLRTAGFEVYDFRHPHPDDNGFHWTEVDHNWRRWTPRQYVEALEHPIAQRGFTNDMDALRACDACVLVLPCGRSAHLELGWAAGAGKRTYVLMDGNGHSYDDRPCSACGDMDGCHGGIEPELMYRMLDGIACSPGELLGMLGVKE